MQQINLASINQHPYLVMFDGMCGLCHAWVRFVLRHDRQGLIRFCSIQSDTGQAIMKVLGFEQQPIESMLYIEHGHVYQKSQAFLRLLRKFKLPASLLRLFVIVPGFLRDYVYDYIASRRYRWFAQRDMCELLNGEYDDRFI